LVTIPFAFRFTNNPAAGRAARLFLAAALAVALPLALRAQENILFDHLTVKEGLSQGSAICMFQDSRGFMWFGTQDGLNRFDGYEFKVYKHDPANPATVNDNFIISIGEDSSHTLWIGTVNQTILSRFDRATETFSHVPLDSVNLAGARISESHSSYTDPAGVQWKGSVGKGLRRTDPRNGKTTVFTHNAADPGSLLDDRVYSVLGDHTGTVWIATRAGLDRFDPKTERFVHYRHDDANPRSLSNNYVWPLLEDRKGNLWVGSYLGGLNRFDRASETFTRYVHDESNPRSLGGDQIYSLYQDSSGMIWVGLQDHGIDRFHPDLSHFTHILRDQTKKNSLADNNVLSLRVDHAGAVWIGTAVGLNRWDRRNGTFTLFKHDPANPRSIADDQVQTMLEDRSGTLWLGTLSSGLDRFDAASGTFTHYKNDPSDPASLSDNRVYALCEDRSGALWVGTYGTGLCRLDRKTGKFTRFLHADSIPASLGAAGAWALLEDQGGTLWVGTYGGGLNRYDPRTGTFTQFLHNDANLKSLSDDAVLSLFEDRSGKLWVGTMNGLNRFDADSFRVYSEKDGLVNATILGILEDDAGHLWMSTNKGVSRLDPRTGAVSNYNYSDGLQGNEFSQGAYAKDSRSGELFFGGANGFNLFRPEELRENPYVPPVVFSAFNRYNTDDEAGTPIAELGIDTKQEITLTYKDNVANFTFAALNFYNTFKNRYAYRLEGYSENWIQLGTDRKATFTNLDAGTYLLRVKGSNNDGRWNETGAALRLIVTPPWWRTTWAYSIYGVLLIGFLYSVRKVEIDRREQKAKIRESELHTKAVEAEKRALEAENERQTKELEDARRLQLSMLPSEVPTIPGYEIAVSMKTATEVGGDYYDFQLTPKGVLNIAFGDATGHGMQAGTIVTLMKGLFISDAGTLEIQKFFNHCSRAIKEIKLGRLYMALTLTRLNGNSVSLSSAGMPPAFLYRKRDGAIEEILLKAVPLGSMKNYPYPLYETTMGLGDTLLLLTDGLPEQKNRQEEMFDYARVVECFRSVADEAPEAIITRLMKEGDSWMNGAQQDDDITLMVVRKKELA